jgi:glutathione peroxidase
MSDAIYDIPVRTLSGEATTLAPHKGKVLLVVNVASRCGFTPQYQGLEALWRKYKDRGLVVAGFPCNQFGAQEPGDEAAIQGFCSTTYDVTFPMFAKIDVNGDAAHPLYQHLKREQKGVLGTEGVKWNFTKFLVARDGAVLDRYASTTKPEDMAKDIERALG